MGCYAKLKKCTKCGTSLHSNESRRKKMCLVCEREGCVVGRVVGHNARKVFNRRLCKVKKSECDGDGNTT